MLTALLFITFIESISSALLQRGIYFYTHEIGAFSETENLLLALGYGIAYVAGAFLSHRASVRLGERRLLLVVLALLCLLHSVLALFNAAWLLVTAVFGTAVLQGMKWPIMESYVSAGRKPRELLPILSRYNVTWATAVFVAVGVSGAIIGSGLPALFFWLPAAINLAAIALAWRLPHAPLHLDHAHPARPNQAEIERMQGLLVSARWSMTASYALLFVLAPLLPGLLDSLQLDVVWATPVASILDAMRGVSFAVMGAWAGWHGRTLPLWLAGLALPAAFLFIVLGGSLPLLVAGEILFGVAAGFAYTAALYYALVAQNASVDAGGAHEGLIGLGFSMGPISGLLGQALSGTRLPGDSGATLAPISALLLAVAPIVALCWYYSLRALVKPRGRPA
jgi:hypothetical protein